MMKVSSTYRHHILGWRGADRMASSSRFSINKLATMGERGDLSCYLLIKIHELIQRSYEPLSHQLVFDTIQKILLASVIMIKKSTVVMTPRPYL